MYCGGSCVPDGPGVFDNNLHDCDRILPKIKPLTFNFTAWIFHSVHDFTTFELLVRFVSMIYLWFSGEMISLLPQKRHTCTTYDL